MILTFSADADDLSLRLDVFISKKAEITRNAAQNLAKDGLVRVCGKTESKNYKIRSGDVVSVELKEPELLDVKAENIPIEIIYEDGDILVVNKPQGMVVHPAAGNFDGTLVNALMHHCGESLSAINGIIRPGIVHRIDKDTSGLLVVAKNNEAHLALADMIKNHDFDREYFCLVNGQVKEDSFTIDKPIGRHPKDRKKMTVTDKNSKNAVTHFEISECFRGYTLLKCMLETGRTHQIRVHLKSIGKSIVGDKLYGAGHDKLSEKFRLSGQLLHAYRLGFVHPASGKYMDFRSDLPPHFKEVLDFLRRQNNM